MDAVGAYRVLEAEDLIGFVGGGLVRGALADATGPFGPPTAETRRELETVLVPVCYGLSG